MRLEPTKVSFFGAEIEKFFVRFFVQVKIAKRPFEINLPLKNIMYSIHGFTTIFFDTYFNHLILSSMCVQKNLEICGKNMAVNFLLQRKRKHDNSIVKSIVTTKVKLDPEKRVF